MAIDSREKRRSMLGLGSGLPPMLPLPVGGFVARARAMLLHLYYGIATRMMMGRRVGFTSWCDPAQAITSYPGPSTLRSWSVSTVSFTSEQD